MVDVIIGVTIVLAIAGIIFALIAYSEAVKKENEAREYARELRSMDMLSYFAGLTYKDKLISILDKRFNAIETLSDYTKVKYTLDIGISKLTHLAHMPEPKFFGEYYEAVKKDLEEYKQQLLANRVSEYTIALATFVALCNYHRYPNGRYSSSYEADEIMVYNKYKLTPVEPNLLEGDSNG